MKPTIRKHQQQISMQASITKSASNAKTYESQSPSCNQQWHQVFVAQNTLDSTLLHDSWQRAENSGQPPPQLSSTTETLALTASIMSCAATAKKLL